MANHSTAKKSNKHKKRLTYIDPTVAGIDIGSQVIYVSVADGKGGCLVSSYDTTTPDLIKIADTLKKAGATTAVMEATGVYWVPLYDILEDRGFEAVLVDSRSVKSVPGRKTDVIDCQWIQTLYSNGVVRAAFRPQRDRIALRAYVRGRDSVVDIRQTALLHMEKALQLMNIKLSYALSDIGGVSGMSIMRAIVGGERDPLVLAGLRNRRVKKSEEAFVRALTGNFQEEYIFSLKQALDLYDFAQQQLVECDEKILANLEVLPDVTTEPLPQRDKDKRADGRYARAQKPRKNDLSFDARTLLWRKSGKDITVLPGIQASTALTIYSELGGFDLEAWESPGAFSSWLKLCPGNNISGGKRRKCKVQPCQNRISQALRMASMSSKQSRTAVGAFTRRICGKTDNLTGIKAGAHKLCRHLYAICKFGNTYYEKGESQYELEQAERDCNALRKRAKKYGYKLVAIDPKEFSQPEQKQA